MRKSCGKTVRSAGLACARLGRLHTINVRRVLVVVRKYPYLVQSLQPLVPALMHRVFTFFTSVRAGVIPAIPSPYKENNKRIYTFFYTYKGAWS